MQWNSRSRRDERAPLPCTVKPKPTRPLAHHYNPRRQQSLDPLPHVAVHVVQPNRVRSKSPYLHRALSMPLAAPFVADDPRSDHKAKLVGRSTSIQEFAC